MALVKEMNGRNLLIPAGHDLSGREISHHFLPYQEKNVDENNVYISGALQNGHIEIVSSATIPTVKKVEPEKVESEVKAKIVKNTNEEPEYFDEEDDDEEEAESEIEPDVCPVESAMAVHKLAKLLMIEFGNDEVKDYGSTYLIKTASELGMGRKTPMSNVSLEEAEQLFIHVAEKLGYVYVTK